MIKNYKLLDEKDPQGFFYVKLTDGKHEGIIYSYGKVEFIEEGETLRLKFDYDIIDDNDIDVDTQEFKQEIGDILMQMIEEGLSKNSLVYTGGVDENRTKDSGESYT